MAEDSLVVDFLVRRNQIIDETLRTNASMRELSNTYDQVFSVNNLVQRSSTQTGKVFTEVDDILQDLNQQIKDNAMSTQRFDINMLRILFTGMALQRVFGGLFRSMTNTFNRLEEGTSQGQENITQLQAGFEFFKFSVFDAIASTDLFSSFVDRGISLLRTLSNILSDPDLSEIILTFSTVGVTAGAGLSAVALLTQIGNLISGLLKEFGLTTTGGLIGGISIAGAIASVALTITDIEAAREAAAAGDTTAFINELFDVIGGLLTTAGLVVLSVNPLAGTITIGIGTLIRFLPEIAGFGEGILEGTGTFLTDIGQAGADAFSAIRAEDPSSVLENTHSFIENINSAFSIFGNRTISNGQSSQRDLISQTDELNSSFTLLGNTTIPDVESSQRDLISQNDSLISSFTFLGDTVIPNAQSSQSSLIGQNRQLEFSYRRVEDSANDAARAIERAARARARSRRESSITREI